MQWRVTLFALLLAACSANEIVPGQVPDDFDCRVAHIAAGDIVLMACSGQGLLQVQIAGITAPSPDKASCQLEQILANSARTYVQSLFQSATSVRVIPDGVQNGRRAAHFVLDGEDVADQLLAAQHAKPYDGTAINWCLLS